MRTKIILAALTLIFSMAGNPPSPLAEETAPQVFLREVLSIGSLDDDLLFMWAGITSDESGHIYVTDAMDYSIKKFDASGRLVCRNGRRGQGPGEFLAPRLLSSSGKLLYATDQNIPGIQVFDQELMFQHRIPYAWAISSMKVLAEDRLAVVPVSVGVNGCVFFINRKGEVLEKVRYCDDNQEMLLNLAEVEVDPDGNIYLAYCFQDRVEKISGGGEKLWSRVLLGGKKVERKKIKTLMVPTQITYKSIALDSSLRLYVLGGGFSHNRSRDVYVLSSEGQHLATLTLPEPSHCIYIDGEGYLYSRADEGTALKKFEMRFLRESRSSTESRK
jgi:hypothetical protein